MKKTHLLFVLLLTSFYGFAQEKQEASVAFDEKQNELKLNMTNVIIFKFLDITYEKALNEESGVGVSVLYNFSDDNDQGLDEYRKFSITPYYRHYFSKQYAEGFFVEGFTMLHTGEENNNIYILYDDSNPSLGGDFKDENYTDLAIGLSTGFKAVSKRGFVAEVYLGIGRDLLGNSDIEVVGRGGISLGYRF
ncbi:DUF3575 domain-containing protein [Olleya namhaensis]|uniref:DUF3575 domain-containing protein n=1 Tax=Olleya namhaensis TaxID=1144750 RepID=UPI00249151C6|nr:DUF3575 domain-containing protein [Olleya namhaensis]